MPAGQRAARSPLPAQPQPTGSGLAALPDTWAAAWGPPGTRICPWGAQVSCPWGCHGPALSQRGCETCGCRAHPADGAAGETPALSAAPFGCLPAFPEVATAVPSSCWALAMALHLGAWGTRHFGQGGERMAQGVGLFPCCWLSGAPLPPVSCRHCCPGAPQPSQGLQSPWGAASPRGTIPVMVCPNELTGLC